ncbi:coiled-coil domain-containing protein 22 homolog [Mercenaria mercenaria]|uniref:coiled-coil domain-containing protein 22 homolog n=1 Tax=Mercenaria mercenaria TaxID=6596 RepID=UPI00234E787E|nr:coiled-coil domain-containing protein 22 homolog [Mercenaria mercenaria]
MEEVDNIILHSLRSINCDIDDEVQSLKEFSTEVIVACAVRCIKTIVGDVDLPNTLPQAMSAKFRMGTTLANHLQELGYRGDVGYQTFLYSSEADIRKIFMFLVDKLPKETVETTEETLGSSVLLQRSIANTLSRQLSSPWVPAYLKQKGITWRGKPPTWQREGTCCMFHFHSMHLTSPEGSADLTKKIPKALKSYYQSSLPYITCQTLDHDDIIPSLLEANAADVTAQQEWEAEWNQSGLASRLSQQEYRDRKRQKIHKRITDQLRQDRQRSEAAAGSGMSQDLQQILASISGRGSGAAKTKGSRFTHTEKLLFAKDEDKAISEVSVQGPAGQTEEEKQKEREEEVDTLKEELNTLTSRLENLDLEVKKFTASIQQMEEEIANQNRANAEKEDGYKVKKRTLDLLPDAENNIAKLQSVVDSSAQRLINLASQWEKHRAPLIDQFRSLKELSSKTESEAQIKLEEIKEFRKKMKQVQDEARTKEELAKQLNSEYERMTKDVNRSAYTKRIMEIVGNIKKQKMEIDKVLVDTRTVQKEINQLSGKLDRQFTVTDELIFRDAKKDESVKKAYRYLAALHESCELLIKTVEETGVIMREIRELEDQTETESNKKVLANLEKITADYQQMKKENDAIVKKIKGKS